MDSDQHSHKDFKPIRTGSMYHRSRPGAPAPAYNTRETSDRHREDRNKSTSDITLSSYQNLSVSASVPIITGSEGAVDK